MTTIGIMGSGRIGRNVFRLLYERDDLANALDGGFAKVVSWCDNEWGCSNRVVDLMDRLAALA